MGNAHLLRELTIHRGAVSATSGQFGDVNGQHGVKLTLQNAQGEPVTFALKSGTGMVTESDTGFDLTLTQTTARSSFTMTGGAAVLHGLADAGSLGAVRATRADLTGDLTIGGTLGSLSLHDVNGGPSHIVISGAGRPTSIHLQRVSQLSIDTASPIAGLAATNWVEPGAVRRHIDAPWLGSFRVTGDFAANVNLSAANHGASIQNFFVSGNLEQVQIRAALGIQRMIVGALNNSLLFAGVQAGLNTLPQGPGDFAAQAKIGVLEARASPARSSPSPARTSPLPASARSSWARSRRRTTAFPLASRRYRFSPTAAGPVRRLVVRRRNTCRCTTCPSPVSQIKSRITC